MFRLRNGNPSVQPEFRLLRVSVLAVVIGMFAGVVAELLHRLIGLVTNIAFYGRLDTEIVSPLQSSLGAGIILVPAIGGLLIGLMAKYGTPMVRGHGIPEAMEAVLMKKSRIPPKVALLKPISAAISIGSGQPFGAEGPIIQTGAALGSILGQALTTPTAERKVLLACGSAAGLAATFGTPIAAVIFAIELLLFEFRARSFIPLAIASTVATAVHMSILGSQPVFPVGEVQFGSPINLIFFLVLGVICGGAAALITRLLYLIEDAFHHLPVSTYLYPAIGGLFVGVVGYLVPHLIYSGVDVFGPGYYVIGKILDGSYAFGFLLVLLLAKAGVWLVSLGSGTSGGVLAPVFMIGAALGAIFGLIVRQLFPGMDTAPVAFAMAGMAAVFGSSTRATFASIVFVFEMTQRYEAILPVMFASVIADVVVNHLMHTSILTEQLRRGGVMVHHEYQADVLEMIPVSAVMDSDPVTISAEMKVRELMTRIDDRDPRLTRHLALLITDEQNKLRGIITRGDLLKVLRESQEELQDETVLGAGTTDVIVTYPDMPIRAALNQMLRNDIGRMPVVSRSDPSSVVGYLSRANVLSAYVQQMNDEAVFDEGWMRKAIRTRRGQRRQKNIQIPL
ncbi:MAG TPA: chloride channel protein [Phototrophicaceae bacterium]|jgi:H+/Cl- antiporter ClcA/CBS domain-containing protein|nr:chloride channel protein [Phototrophicaceae bacterium]